jgi:hypothetical protein
LTLDDTRLAVLADRMAELAAEEARRLVSVCAGCLNDREVSALEVMERAAQESSARIGRAVITGIVGLAGEDPDPTTGCGNGHQARLVQQRPRMIRTLLGGVMIRRGYYHCESCHRGFAPLDDRLGVTGTSLSPGLTQASALAGMEMPYATAVKFIEQVTGLPLASASTVNRVTITEGARARDLITTELANAKPNPLLDAWTQDRPDKCYIVIDGTGAPMLCSQTIGRAGKTQDRATTREVKIGCLFTQSSLDQDGQPVQDPHSMTYVTTFDPAPGFARQAKAEYHRRGFDQLRQPVILGDGAKWIWAIADNRFPAATQIVDYYHAKEHLATLTTLLAPLTDDPVRFAQNLTNALDQGDITAITETVAKIGINPGTDLAHHTDTMLAYFTSNQHRMQYNHYKQQGYFIGSGAVESACNSLVKQRAKRAGMHWTIKGLDPIIALRTLNQSNRLGLLWNTITSRHPQKT